MLRAAFGTGFVVLAQAATISVLYYLRVRRLWEPANSDILVFLLPSLASVFGGAALCWGSGIAEQRGPLRGVVAIFWGLLGGAIGLEAAFLFAFNRWGT